MIAIGSCTNSDPTNIPNFDKHSFDLDYGKLSCAYDFIETDDIVTDKFKFIQYWKHCIKNIHIPYKNKCQTFAYVFIRPMIHIRTLFKLYRPWGLYFIKSFSLITNHLTINTIKD